MANLQPPKSSRLRHSYTPDDSDESGREQSAVFQHSPGSSKLKVEYEPGCQPDEVYDRLLPPWRAKPRRWLVTQLRRENAWMAEWQKKIRTKRRDEYFYWTAIFGTHTFFMTFLPMLFFFGYPDKGRDMLHVVGLGIYISSVAKDLACVPRPYSPPVIRLSMSTHHHEYGFPSSHSTNSVSIAVLFGEWLWSARDTIGMPAMLAGWLVMLWYATSVVGGRLYTGMHSIVDIICGVGMGVGCWLFVDSFGAYYESWVEHGPIEVPLILTVVALLLVHVHPEPVDDCPCFEDSIAILSVILGISLGHWQVANSGCRDPCVPTKFILDYTWLQAGVVAIFRIVFGVGLMFGWRLVAKAVLLRILPPIFRFASSALDFNLPTRRFYTPATAYSKVPHSSLRPIPSFVDLHANGGTSTDVTPASSGAVSPVNHLQIPNSNETATGLRKRSSVDMQKPIQNGHDATGLDKFPEVWISRRKRKSRTERAHYDAEVLTKFGVYAGMGWIAGTGVEILFSIIERRVFKNGDII